MDDKKHIELLEQIVELQKKRIADLESRMILNVPLAPMPTYHQMAPLNVSGCPMGGLHEYPLMWHGTNPPSCVKCGHAPVANPYQITSVLGRTNGEVGHSSNTGAALGIGAGVTGIGYGENTGLVSPGKPIKVGN